MRVLLTNNTLANRAGTELYLRDVALELMRRGHHPVAYSTQLGEVAEELKAATVPVISRLESLGEAPDIIHGHHHYDTLAAMMWFRATPAISFCHGWQPWEEAPLRFPRILRYVAVDELCRERLITEGGIAPDKIDVILNFFDENLFPSRAPLPVSPRKALVFSNMVREDSDLAVLRQACKLRGIELHCMGIAAGNPEPRPGKLLASYDIVFAKARAAIEAMAVGAAVVLTGPGRLGPMVSSQNFDSLRPLNFGVRTLSRPLTVEMVVNELKRYDPRDAAAVSALVRQNCELKPAVDKIVKLYERVIDEARRGQLAPSIDCDRSVARYLEISAPQHKESTRALDRLRAREAQAALQRRIDELAGQLRMRDGKHLAALELEIASIRSSATWRWSQNVLQNRLVRFLFGRFIQSVATRSQSATAGTQDQVPAKPSMEAIG